MGKTVKTADLLPALGGWEGIRGGEAARLFSGGMIPRPTGEEAGETTNET